MSPSEEGEVTGEERGLSKRFVVGGSSPSGGGCSSVSPSGTVYSMFHSLFTGDIFTGSCGSLSKSSGTVCLTEPFVIT